MGRTLTSLARLRKISAVMVRHGLGHLLEQRRHKKSEKSLRVEATDIPDIAQRFRNVLEELGPTFVKFGQILSTRGDLLPAGFAEALRGLQDHAAALPFSVIEEQMRLAFGPTWRDQFARFDEEPVASASIAQVHRAQLVDGREVAVKVQRPHLRAQMQGDLDLLHVLAQLCHAIIEESGMITPRALVEEFESMLLGELDFAREAQMQQRFWENAQEPGRTYTVPELIKSVTAGPVLTMQWLQGRRLGDIAADAFGRKVAANVVRASFDQLFVDGLFHADPHPGNCFVLDDGRLGLIDFGAVARLSHATRETLVILVLSIGVRDAGAIARLLYRVGAPEKRVSLAALRDACAALLDERLRDRHTFAEQDAAGMLQDLFEMAARFGIRIPSEYALIARAAVTVEGVLRQLDPSFAVIDDARPMLRKLVEDQFRPSEWGGQALRNVLRARDLARELPLTLSQITMDLEQGKLRLQIDNPHLASIARNIDTLGVVIFMGLVAAALITGSMFVLARNDTRLFGLPMVPLVGLYLASMLFGTALGRYLLAPRLRKISLRRLLRRRRPD